MYSLVEIFRSLQGEGANAGRQCVFVRFAGCNLKCPWCDTDHTARFTLSLEDLLSEIKTEFHNLSPFTFHLSPSTQPMVVLTGGEPTIQPEMPELLAALRSAGYYVAIETNGTNEPDWLPFVDYIACSPKLEHLDRLVLTHANEVRVVMSVDTPEAIAALDDVQRRVSADRYYVSPCERNGSFDFAAAKSALAAHPDWLLSVQLHKLLGFR